MTEPDSGVVFPLVDGARSTSALGRAVVADALRAVDPVGSRAAGAETNWRSGYPLHFRRLVDAGLTSGDAARTIAREGLFSVYDRLRWAPQEAPEAALEEARHASAGAALSTTAITGSAEPERRLTLPYRGDRLGGPELLALVEGWVTDGIVEPSVATAVRTVQEHPEWLALPDQLVVVVGAGAEMGPMQALLRWGATVAGLDLPHEPVWERVIATARRGAGTLLVPTAAAVADLDDAGLARVSGIDVIRGVPEAADWVAALEPARALTLGNYVYADAAMNVRVSAAVDVMSLRVLDQRRDTALAFLATPTDVFAVPAEAVAHATGQYADRSRLSKVAGRPLRTLSAGRLLRRNYLPDADPGVNDAMVPQQGPNYLLAKRLQRWRATVARAEGTTVSMNVAPPTRTRSVVKNRALAAAYAGAHRFGVQVFEPATSNTLMAVLLVHDLHTGGGPAHDHPWQDEAHQAVHGGLWRAAYAPTSALGLAALLGFGASR